MRQTLTIYGDMRAWLEMAKAEHDAKFAACPWVFLMTAESGSAPFEKRGLQPVSALACQICFFTICADQPR